MHTQVYTHKVQPEQKTVDKRTITQNKFEDKRPSFANQANTINAIQKTTPVQLLKKTPNSSGVIQRKNRLKVVASITNNIDGPLRSFQPANTKKNTGILIEMPAHLNSQNEVSTKIANGSTHGRDLINTAFAIGLNAECTDLDASNAPLEQDLSAVASNIIEQANTHNTPCSVISMLWKKPTGQVGNGYILPFMEARYKLGQHEKTQALVGRLNTVNVFHRLMDQDVSNDPLLGGYNATNNPRVTRTRDENHQVLEETLGNSQEQIITGGYNWNAQEAADPMKASIIRQVNMAEHEYRQKLHDAGKSSFLYCPEPNIYITHAKKQDWDNALKSAADHEDENDNKAQMNESLHARRYMGYQTMTYNHRLSTTKPLKTYFPDAPQIQGEIGWDSLVQNIQTTQLQPLGSPGHVTAKQAAHTTFTNLKIHQSHLTGDKAADIKTKLNDENSPLLPEIFHEKLWNRICTEFKI